MSSSSAGASISVAVSPLLQSRISSLLPPTRHHPSHQGMQMTTTTLFLELTLPPSPLLTTLPPPRRATMRKSSFSLVRLGKTPSPWITGTLYRPSKLLPSASAALILSSHVSKVDGAEKRLNEISYSPPSKEHERDFCVCLNTSVDTVKIYIEKDFRIQIGTL